MPSIPRTYDERAARRNAPESRVISSQTPGLAPTLHLTPMHDDLKEALFENMGAALGRIPSTTEDGVLFETVVAQEGGLGCQKFFEAIARSQGQVSIGIRCMYIEAILNAWSSERARFHAMILPDLLVSFTVEGSAVEIRLLDSACRILRALSLQDTMMAARPSHAPGDDCALASNLSEAGSALLELGHEELAYNFIAMSLDHSGGCSLEFVEQVAREGIRLGQVARKVHQAAFCTIALADVMLAKAETVPERRGDAFKLCELAIERLRQCPPYYANAGAKKLGAIIRRHEYVTVRAGYRARLQPRGQAGRQRQCGEFS